jgi:hypothetical protein
MKNMAKAVLDFWIKSAFDKQITRNLRDTKDNLQDTVVPPPYFANLRSSILLVLGRTYI